MKKLLAIPTKVKILFFILIAISLVILFLIFLMKIENSIFVQIKVKEKSNLIELNSLQVNQKINKVNKIIIHLNDNFYSFSVKSYVLTKEGNTLLEINNSDVNLFSGSILNANLVFKPEVLYKIVFPF